jgi:hypothetical protein
VTEIVLGDAEAAGAGFALEEAALEEGELLLALLPHPDSTTTASTENPLMRRIALPPVRNRSTEVDAVRGQNLPGR